MGQKRRKPRARSQRAQETANRQSRLGREQQLRDRRQDEFAATLDALSDLTLRERLEDWVGREVAARDAIRRHVAAARRRGWSWTEVGEVLGVTRQSARERFRSVDDERG